MKALQITAFASLLLGSLSAHAGQPIINLSVGGEVAPGVYGQVQFGNAPPPPVVYEQPTVIVHEQGHVEERPIYLHVPPGHAKHWAKHCHEYNACNRPVYFVRSREYEPDYRPGEERHREEERRDEGRRDEGNRGEGHRGEERRDERRDEDRGGNERRD